MSTTFEAADLDAAQTLLSELYAVTRFSSAGERHHLRVEQQQLGPIVLGRMTFRMTIDGFADPVGANVLVGVRDGHATYRHGSDETAVARGDVVLAAEHNRPMDTSIEDLDGDFVLLPPALLNDVAQPAPHDVRPVRMLGHRPINPAAAARWASVHAAVKDLFAESAEDPGGGLVVAQAARLLAAVTLVTFPNTALLDPTIEDRHDAHSDTLRRAIAFIEANPRSPITITDIAAASVVTARAIQLAFRRHLDTTPMGYLRWVRLDLAHRDLVAADPARTTVTAIATHWGFANPSRFAKAYRDVYGRLPSQTLQG